MAWFDPNFSMTDWLIGEFHWTTFVFRVCAITLFTEDLFRHIEAFLELYELSETLVDGV